MRRHSNSLSSTHLLGAASAFQSEIYTGNSSSDSRSSHSNGAAMMKTPEGTRNRRSVLRKITGWWKKKHSYYVDIHQELRQDCTLFPEEESLSSFLHQPDGDVDDNDIFDASSFTPSPAAVLAQDAPEKITSSLDTPQTPHCGILPPHETPLRMDSSSTPVAVKTARSSALDTASPCTPRACTVPSASPETPLRNNSKTARSSLDTSHYTPHGSIVPSASPETPLRHDNDNATPPMDYSTPTIPEVEDSEDLEEGESTTPLGGKPLVRHPTPATTPRVSNRHHHPESPPAAAATPEASSQNIAQPFRLTTPRLSSWQPETPATAAATPEASPCLFSPPIFPNSKKVQSFRLPVDDDEPQGQPTRSASASHSSRTQHPQQEQQQQQQQQSPSPLSPPSFPETQEESLLTLPFVRSSSVSTGSLLSMDSVADSYCWKDDNDDDWSYVSPTPTKGIFGDFFDEHVTFLRIQTKPRQVEVVWAEDDIQSIH